MEKIVKHTGIVTAVEKNMVHAKMRVVSACSACEAHANCGFAEAKDKTVDIATTKWQEYQPGDNVNITIRTGNGLLAVIIAYVLPSFILLGTFILLCLLPLSEPVVALITLLIVALYGGVLYMLRNKLQRKFSFDIEKI